MNIQKLMQEATRVQREITKKQEEINATSYEAKSGHVSVVLNGKKEVLSIDFNKDLVTDKDDLDALADMIKLAMNEAVAKVDKDVEAKLGVYGKGLNGLF